MGKNDIIMSRWLSDKGRFAGLFNGVLFRGNSIIQPGDLEVVKGEADILIVDKKGKEKAFKRYRDIVMRWKRGVQFVILASENQERTHYAMPVRNMLYDSVSYTEQIDEICTLVFYYGNKPWDGSLDIHGMFPRELDLSSRETLEKYVPNYRINLIDVMRIQDTESFQRDLQVIFEMLKYKHEKQQLKDYINDNKSFFQKINQDTYNAICVLLNSEKQLKHIAGNGHGEEEIDMCKALDDLYEDGVAEGIEKGEERLGAVIQLLIDNGRANEISMAVSDKAYRESLFIEFDIQKEFPKSIWQ